MEDLKRLDGKVFREYISKKIEPIEEILAEALDVDNFEYDRSTLAKGVVVWYNNIICTFLITDVPGYIQEVLLNLVLVHHEVYKTYYIVPVDIWLCSCTCRFIPYRQFQYSGFCPACWRASVIHCTTD